MKRFLITALMACFVLASNAFGLHGRKAKKIKEFFISTMQNSGGTYTNDRKVPTDDIEEVREKSLEVLV